LFDDLATEVRKLTQERWFGMILAGCVNRNHLSCGRTNFGFFLEGLQ